MSIERDVSTYIHQQDTVTYIHTYITKIRLRAYIHTSPRYGYIHTRKHRLDTCVRTYPPVARRRNTRKSSFDTYTKSADERDHLSTILDMFN